MGLRALEKPSQVSVVPSTAGPAEHPQRSPDAAATNESAQVIDLDMLETPVMPYLQMGGRYHPIDQILNDCLKVPYLSFGAVCLPAVTCNDESSYKGQQ